jgi:pyruvate,water dikinase
LRICGGSELFKEGIATGGKHMSPYVLGLQEIDRTQLTLVGGKGANLGELSRIADIHVPDGFCLSTEAFQRVIGEISSMRAFLEQLALLKVEDRATISELSSEIRRTIEGAAIPQDMQAEIARSLARLDERCAWAVRSSATAEDLPTASFAGQQDTYLNIIGKEAIFKHISKCWASLFTERAVLYRIQNGFDHRKVSLAVVVQQMVFPMVAGTLFTADPATSHRRVLSIEASFGLGEALVSGLVNADNYTVRDGKIIEKKIASKQLAIYALEGGGTKEQEIAPEQQSRQALTDEQILQLEHIGRRIEAHFGCPQDIEWCLAAETFSLVQSRPITTLFPIPEAHDQENHVYISVGHQQMMTDAIKPLGISFWQLTAARPMSTAGGRLFVDVTPLLASSVSKQNFLNGMEQHDPLLKDALVTIVERGDFIQLVPDEQQEQRSRQHVLVAGAQTQIENDPTIVSDLMQKNQASIEELKQTIQLKSGPDLFDFLLEDIQQLKKILFDPQSTQVFMAAINASSWLNANIQEWLGEKSVADTLSQSVPNNVTSEMGLALLDVADVIRPYPEAIEYLEQVKDEHFLDELVQFAGGQQIRDAISAFLDRYGMRCVGEIDITRTRWSEKPATLIPMLLSNIKNVEPGASTRKFEQGLQEALAKEQEIVDRLEQLPDGQRKAAETRQKISLVRNFIGYREYPKYGMISRYLVYKQALLKEVEQLVQAGVLREKEDSYYLTFQELREVVSTRQLDYQVINQRKNEFRLYEKLTPPRVLTSDGEIVTGKYKRDNLPVNALAGLPVSSGVIEGRARVLFTIEDATIEAGDILVTPFTDPSWTTLFVSIKGLVTEVGGLMTHGAVIAREYGLPAVTGVEHATRLIKDGERIRVNGSEGYVEIL